jgi:metal-responsive CopG/Arc/MetJ family transcriptional regulator
MRLHITLSDDVVRELDSRVGPRRRSAFIVAAVRAALDDASRWDRIESALATIADDGHDWDEDPAAWVHQQRGTDASRIG